MISEALFKITKTKENKKTLSAIGAYSVSKMR